MNKLSDDQLKGEPTAIWRQYDHDAKSVANPIIKSARSWIADCWRSWL